MKKNLKLEWQIKFDFYDSGTKWDARLYVIKDQSDFAKLNIFSIQVNSFDLSSTDFSLQMNLTWPLSIFNVVVCI